MLHICEPDEPQGVPAGVLSEGGEGSVWKCLVHSLASKGTLQGWAGRSW